MKSKKTSMAAAAAGKEKAKANRRRKIRLEARRMMEEAGHDGFSMRSLAEAAGVSQATPYNLFGSKNALLLSVYNDDIAEFTQMLLEYESASNLERLFDVLSISTDLFSRREKFYKAMMHTLNSDASAELRAGLRDPRNGFYAQLVEGAISSHQLVQQSNSKILGHALGTVHGAVITEWVAGEISPKQMLEEASFHFAMILLTFATEETQLMLRNRAIRHQNNIAVMRSRLRAD